MIQIIKKDNTVQPFDISKVISAVNKSAYRAIYKFSDTEVSLIENFVTSAVNDPNNWEKEENGDGYLTVPMMHNIVEKCLTNIAPTVAQSYRDYRNYKTSFVAILDSVYKKSQAIMYIGDKENANSDSTLVSTKRSLIFGQLNKELYQKFQLTVKQLQACKDGYIYVHDMSSRRDCINCCLADVGNVLKGGFEMGNIWYNEPKSLDVAFDVIGDIILSAAAQQYGGYTVPRIDEILIPYAKKSYDTHFNKHFKSKMRSIMNVMGYTSEDEVYHNFKANIEKEAHEEAMDDVRREMEQGFQGLEIKLNTVASSRGDYPFTTFTIGVSTDIFASMAAEVCLEVRAKGQGAPGKKKSVLFPKLVFTYTEDLHGEGKELNWLFEKALDCSLKAMYPDFLSLDGNTVIAEMWHKYGEIIAPMGCRAFLSPFYERGGVEPADENDKPFFTGRFNIGVVSLNLPMIYAKSKQENLDFYTVLDEYLELAREVHIMTYNYLGNMRASTNPVMFCQGGFHNGNLNSNDKIKPLLKYSTASFGITALNELNRIHNGKSIREDGQFPLEVMEYINKKAKEFKAEDHINYAIYGTPAESLCLSSDTPIRTYEGIKQIKDIKVGDLVYSFNEEQHKVELKKVLRSMKTSDSAKVVKVKFDNGQEVICTPNHPFAVRTMVFDERHRYSEREVVEWTKAEDLKPGMRIKSNYIHLNHQGRQECSIYHNGQRQLIQDVNAEYAYGSKPKGYVTHHKDENKTNNLFENLEYMSSNDHKIHHMKDTIMDYCYTSEDQSGENNSFYGKHHSDETKLKLRNLKKGRAVCVYDLEGNLLDKYECLDDVEKAGFTRHLAKLACHGKNVLKSCLLYFGHLYNGYLWYFEGDYVNTFSPSIVEANHKVISIEELDNPIPTYNIEVEDNHNFFVGGDDGILVHNCGTQVNQFRSKYGIVENVSDRDYVSNSFHCHVSEEMDGIEKQDKEFRFWELFQGGRIQYVKYDINYNKDAVRSYVTRAMKMGLYEGVNFTLCYCEDCGKEGVGVDACPKCGSKNLTKIERMNGLN